MTDIDFLSIQNSRHRIGYGRTGRARILFYNFHMHGKQRRKEKGTERERKKEKEKSVARIK